MAIWPVRIVQILVCGFNGAEITVTALSPFGKIVCHIAKRADNNTIRLLQGLFGDFARSRQDDPIQGENMNSETGFEDY